LAVARSENRERAGADRDSKRARRAEPAPASKPTETRVVGKKTFNLIDGVWTDKDHRSDKEIPAVTITRDSDLYSELLAKQPGLRTFLNAFPASQGVVLVYKGTLYRIQPRK
jgi:hypothetical protein